MKYSPYSYSKISTYQQCPRKFKYKYIDKVKVPFVYSEALMKGGAVHHILEYHPEKSTHKYQEKYQNIADNFINSETGKLLFSLESKREMSIGLTENIEPCNYSDENVMLRGYVDYYTIYNDYLWIVDYKTGKLKDPRWQSYDQNLWYSIYFFKKFSKLNKIKITYQYVEHLDSDNSIILKRKYLDNYIKSLMINISNIEKDDKFNKSESKLCDYCDFKEICLL